MLLKSDAEGVQKLLDAMDEECKAIKRNALKLSWYLRGGATYEDILNMTTFERNEIVKIIESNLETTKNTKLPFF